MSADDFIRSQTATTGRGCRGGSGPDRTSGMHTGSGGATNRRQYPVKARPAKKAQCTMCGHREGRCTECPCCSLGRLVPKQYKHPMG